METDKTVIAVDIGGTKISAGVVDAEGNILSSLRVSTPPGTTDDIISAINYLIDELFNSASKASEVIGIGLATAGTVDFRRGVVVESPNLPFRELQLKSIIESRFGLPTFLDNDGNLAALGEIYYGVAQGAQDVVGLTIGTGIGAGIIIDGCLYRGATGSAAEIGHMVIEATGPRCTCGSYGCFEEMASGRALVNLAKKEIREGAQSLIWDLADGRIENITGQEITEAARKRDKLAVDIFNEVGFWLGIGINNIVNIFNPEMVVVGGGVADAGELILNPAKQVVTERALHPNQDVVKIVLSNLGNKAGILGAAALVFDELSLS